MLASAVSPATLHAACCASGYVFSEVLAGASSPDVTRRSLAMTIPSRARIPTHVPALLIASIAYSTWKIFRQQSGGGALIIFSFPRGGREEEERGRVRKKGRKIGERNVA
jgi:hypothetical protein